MDIVFAIAEIAAEDGLHCIRNWVAQLAGVSRAFHRAVKPLIFRIVHLHSGNVKSFCRQLQSATGAVDFDLFTRTLILDLPTREPDYMALGSFHNLRAVTCSQPQFELLAKCDSFLPRIVTCYHIPGMNLTACSRSPPSAASLTSATQWRNTKE